MTKRDTFMSLFVIIWIICNSITSTNFPTRHAAQE